MNNTQLGHFITKFACSLVGWSSQWTVITFHFSLVLTYITTYSKYCIWESQYMQWVDDKCLQFISLLLTCPNKNIIFKRKWGYTYETVFFFFFFLILNILINGKERQSYCNLSMLEILAREVNCNNYVTKYINILFIWKQIMNGRLLALLLIVCTVASKFQCTCSVNGIEKKH